MCTLYFFLKGRHNPVLPCNAAWVISRAMDIQELQCCNNNLKLQSIYLPIMTPPAVVQWWSAGQLQVGLVICSLGTPMSGDSLSRSLSLCRHLFGHTTVTDSSLLFCLFSHQHRSHLPFHPYTLYTTNLLCVFGSVHFAV